MSTIHLHETTTGTPEEFLAGLTDFGPGRLELFGPVAWSRAAAAPRRPRPGQHPRRLA